MIYTVTLNPSLDYILEIDTLLPGAVNRSKSSKIMPGGKGINVSVVLNNLSVDTKALGFIAGFTGQELLRLLQEEGVDSDFITLKDGNSRINVKLKSPDSTELNANGPVVDEEAIAALMVQLQSLKAGDVLVLAGSIPNTMPNQIYCDIMEKLFDKGIHFVVDATGDLLKNTLKYKPFLIKPNHHELAELFNKKLESDDDIITCGKELQKMGAENVLVSMAENGAILLGNDGRVYKASAPKGHVINAVGAGDSMVAGFLAGYFKNKDLKEALTLGICTGSASAFSENLATGAEIKAIHEAYSHTLSI